MRKELNIDRRVAAYGSKKEIEEAEAILTKEIPELANLEESEARLRIQDVIDRESVKASVLFDGNTVWSFKKVIRHLNKVVKEGVTQNMSKYLYEFFHLCCGTIAHYNKIGWSDCYPDTEALRKLFQRNEFGERVYEHIPCWKTDARRIAKKAETILGIQK